MAAALRFRSFRKPHLREVKLHNSAAKLGGPAELPRTDLSQIHVHVLFFVKKIK